MYGDVFPLHLVTLVLEPVPVGTTRKYPPSVYAANSPSDTMASAVDVADICVRNISVFAAVVNTRMSNPSTFTAGDRNKSM
jgi:hypothetical protein